MKRTGQLLGIVAFLGAASALAGCGDASMADVHGQITVDGHPLEKGAISFYPVDGKAPTAGSEVKAGAYAARVPLGTMRVEISAPKVVGKKKLYNTPNSPQQDLTAEALPARYNKDSKLTLEVRAGHTEKNWELKSK